MIKLIVCVFTLISSISLTEGRPVAKAENSAPTSLYRERRSFAKIPDVMDVPNLIAIQTESFDWFKNEGLAQAFADVCPIENNTGDMCVEFGKHEFGEPKYTVDECKEKDVTYQAPLFVEIRFINRCLLYTSPSPRD